MRTYADYCFTRLLADLLAEEPVETRNSKARPLFGPRFEFDSLPLITVRPTAPMKALREMEWFMSGYAHCRPELNDWWRGQLDSNGRYLNGYPTQLRSSTYCSGMRVDYFDQIAHIVDSIRNHPHGRRGIITAWNPGEMARITETNDNPNTPTTCHLSFVQFHVKRGALNMLSVQRSADVLLGLPHNWVQHWSLLAWLAHHCGLSVGRMIWVGGDVHLYDEPSHLECAREIVESDWARYMTRWVANAPQLECSTPSLDYTPSTPTESVQAIADGYRAADFRIVWPDGQNKPEPLSTVRPVLL